MFRLGKKLGRTVKIYCTCRPNIPEDQKQRLSPISTIKNLNKNVYSRLENLPSVRTAVFEVGKFVEKTTHKDEVRRSEAKVMEIKKQLVQVADEKRSLLQNLDNIRNDLHQIYTDLKIHRNKETYLDLARKEVELCEKEKSLTDMYKLADIKEQTLFSNFSTAVEESYEKGKLHTNFIKVISKYSLLAVIMFVLFHAFQYNRSRKKKESWGSYLHRHTRWVYSWAIR